MPRRSRFYISNIGIHPSTRNDSPQQSTQPNINSPRRRNRNRNRRVRNRNSTRETTSMHLLPDATASTDDLELARRVAKKCRSYIYQQLFDFRNAISSS